MNRRILPVIVGFVLLVGLTAGLLMRIRTNYVLGQPGVKLVNEPIYNDLTNVVSEISAYLPATIEDYSSARVEPITSIEQTMLPPDTVFGRRIYEAPDKFAAMVSIVVMGTDRTSIHKPQYCLMGSGEEIIGSEVITVPISSPKPYDLQVMKLSTRTQKRVASGQTVPVSGVFLYWFVADGHLTPYHGERMWLMARDLVTTGLLQRWAYVAYFARCSPGQENALVERMKKFIASSVPEFQLTAGNSAQAAASTAHTDFAKN